MSEIANYTFLPWLREGIANRISGQSGLRATIDVDLTLTGEDLDGGSQTLPPIKRQVEIYGPGDIVGVESSAIIKTEPRHWIANFEPNYLPYIEFYDEDFPWRYSPEVPSNHRLTPWIMLIVLEEGEFGEGRNVAKRPLPYITLAGAPPLPPADQLWAWAHVHLDKNTIGAEPTSNDGADIAASVGAALRSNPDLGHSRIMCPRKLQEKKGYHAFLVPVFETGRLAGLGEDPAGAPAHDTRAWADAVPAELPYYHRWHFRTAPKGDFEYLVRLLEPQPVDSRVGLRDMDVQEPGANITGIVDDPLAPPERQVHGVLRLGGALRVPDINYTPEEFAVVEKYRQWATLHDNAPDTHPFQASLASFVNLTDAYQTQRALDANAASNIDEVLSATDPDHEFDIANNPDPLITAPLYGRWHSLTQRLLVDRNGAPVDPDDNWVHDLNLDPRWRVAAGFGTLIVQENQETYMQAAWEQVGEVLEANQRVRQAQLAGLAAWAWYDTTLRLTRSRRNSRWMTLAAPVHARVLHDGVTVRHEIATSRVPAVALAPATRKVLSPRGRTVGRLGFTDSLRADDLLERLNSGGVSAAPPREVPAVPTDADLAEELKSDVLPQPLGGWLERHRWLRWLAWIVLVVLILLLLLLFGPAVAATVGAVLAIAAGALQVWLERLLRQIDAADSVLAENQTREAVDELPASPDFRISSPGDGFVATIDGTDDSDEAARYKLALRDLAVTMERTVSVSTPPPKLPIDLTAAGTATFLALDPRVTLPNWVYGGLAMPPRIDDAQDEGFEEAMAYPEIDLPMYKPLADHSAELFLPNVNHVAENSISLLETNQEFIEAYMVGLNHEFARELMWREYPTDQRGSYFRQFWEARGFYDAEGLTAEELHEKLLDIPPIHRWLKRSDLGDHDHREEPGEDEAEVVLVIRGELLKRYPNAIIYAHRAVWRDDTEAGLPILDISGGQTIDLTKERDLRPLSEDEEADPPRTIVKTPLYEAKVEPDIYFFGFDLTACEAKGGTGREDDPVDPLCAAEGMEWHDAGWFFCIKEREGELTMGLDVRAGSAVSDVKVWNDLAWDHVTPAVPDGGYLQINDDTTQINLAELDPDEKLEKGDQHKEDRNIRWRKRMSSADLAYVLYQVPVLVAVHGAEMLRDV